MKSNILIFIVLALVIAGGSYYVSLPKPPTEATTETNNNLNAEPTVVATTGDSMVQEESRYIVYSKTAFETAKGKKRIYFFHAPWCPTCRPADAAFQKDAAHIPENVVLFKTDYDTSAELKKQYAVTYQHTFIQVDENGREVTRWNGGAIAELTANIR